MSKFSDLPNAKCYHCGEFVDSRASILCNACHTKEVARLTARCGDLNDSGEKGTCPGEYGFWSVREYGYHQDGRVIRKPQLFS